MGNLFTPGTFSGTPTSYRLLAPHETGFPLRKHDFAPSFGFAYTPDFKTGMLHKLVGENGQTVIRGGYSIAYTREGFSAYTSMFGANEGGTVTLNVSPSLTGSIFPNGGVSYNSGAGLTCKGTPVVCTPGFPALTPPADTSKYPFTPGGASGGSANDFDSHLKAGYTQSFSFGIQRELDKNTAVEVRWVRTRGTHLWRQMDLNEVNIFENGFLNTFNATAAKLTPNCGQTGFPACNYGPGFIATAVGSQTDSTVIQFLQQGQAGALANSIAFTSSRMNNLINAGLIPFTTLAASPGGCDPTLPAASQNCKVSNFFILNPQTTAGAFLMTQGTDTNFNALQIEVRRRLSAGLLFQGSYQFAKALSNAFVSSSSVFSQPRTLRNAGLDRNYSPWDIRHAFKLDYIYELPFGPGKRWANSSNGLISRLAGHWQIGGVTRIQSGPATLLTSGGRATVNQNDSGLVVHGLTLQQLQKQVKIRKTATGVVYWLPQALIDNTISAFNSATGVPADPSSPWIGPPTTPGQLGQRIVLFGPMTARFDFNIMKRIPITERVNLEGRVSFLNAFNRANFFIGDADSTIRSASAASQSFGQTRSAYRDITVSGTNDPGGRLIEFQFRLNF